MIRLTTTSPPTPDASCASTKSRARQSNTAAVRLSYPGTSSLRIELLLSTMSTACEPKPAKSISAGATIVGASLPSTRQLVISCRDVSSVM